MSPPETRELPMEVRRTPFDCAALDKGALAAKPVAASLAACVAGCPERWRAAGRSGP
jgi:hypothetical protein